VELCKPRSPNARDLHPMDEDLSMGTPDLGHPGVGVELYKPRSPNARDLHPMDEDLSMGTPDLGHSAW
jgi:hypothetical protein